MVTLITRPRPGPIVVGTTGAERARRRLHMLVMSHGMPQPTKETRQNRRAFERKARKQKDDQ